MHWPKFAALLVFAVVLVVDGTGEGGGRTSRRNRRATGTGVAQNTQNVEAAPPAQGSRRGRQSTATGGGSGANGPKRAGSRRGRLLEKAGVHRTTVDMSAYIGEWQKAEIDESKILRGMYSKITFTNGANANTYTVVLSPNNSADIKLENFRLRQGRERVKDEEREAARRDGTIVSSYSDRCVISYEFYIDELHPHQLRCDVTEVKLGDESPFEDRWIFELSKTSAKDDTLTVKRKWHHIKEAGSQKFHRKPSE